MSVERQLLKEIIRHFADGGLAIIASNSDVGETLHNAKELLAQPEQIEQTPDYYLWFDEVHEEHPTNDGDPDVMPLYLA